MSAERTIQAELETVCAELGDLQGVTCVGTAGTITTLAAMAQKLSKYESARIHNYRLTLQKIQGLERELRSRTRAERREIPGLETGREDVILAGTVILRVVMQTLGFQECLVSDYGPTGRNFGARSGQDQRGGSEGLRGKKRAKMSNGSNRANDSTFGYTTGTLWFLGRPAGESLPPGFSTSKTLKSQRPNHAGSRT